MTKFRINPSEIEAYFDRLWPIFRSITGEGVRETHKILSEIVPLTTIEIPTGTQVFDWMVPKEWVVHEAYLIGPDGDRILDIVDNNLHLLNYSVPFIGEVALQELNEHLYSIPEMPKAVPYVTSYYEPRWGFCMSDEKRKKLVDGTYKIHIDTELVEGSMTVSDAILPGSTKQEILFSTYTCHPSLANNELSGPLVTAFIYKYLSQIKDRRFTYRFIFGPETIGAIAYLSINGEYLKKHMHAGFVVTCVGDSGKYSYKKSRNGNSVADNIVEYIVNATDEIQCEIMDFFPWGSDERQYCSPGFDLPVGSLTRTMYGKYPEYHTSFDNKGIISFDAMIDTIELYVRICEHLEQNRIYINKKPHGEPHLSKYNLYPTLSDLSKEGNQDYINAIRWVLSYSDGKHDLIDIAKLSEIPFEIILSLAEKCEKKGLIEEYNDYEL